MLNYSGSDKDPESKLKLAELGFGMAAVMDRVLNRYVDPVDGEDISDRFYEFSEFVSQYAYDLGFSAGRLDALGMSPEQVRERDEAMARRAAQSWDPLGLDTVS